MAITCAALYVYVPVCAIIGRNFSYFLNIGKFMCLCSAIYYSTDDGLLRKAFTDILNCCDIYFTYILLHMANLLNGFYSWKSFFYFFSTEICYTYFFESSCLMTLMIIIIIDYYFLTNILHYIFLFISLGRFVRHKKEKSFIFLASFSSPVNERKDKLSNFTKLTGKCLCRKTFFRH